MEILNRKARFNYEIIDTIECGIVYILNMHISPYENGGVFNHDETRTRKLLLHKNQILKLKNKLELDGFTLVPLKLYFVNGRAKIELGLCRGKKIYDKRESSKKRDIERELKKQYKV